MVRQFTTAIFFLVNITLQAQNEEKRYEMERLIRQKNNIKQTLMYEFDLDTNDSILIARQFYDRTGRLIQNHDYNSTGKLQYKSILSYNHKGLQTQETGYDANGNLMQLFVYTYDKNDHQTDYQQLDSDKKVLTHQKSVFNSKGQRVKLYNQLSDQGGFYLSTTFVYDRAGRSLRHTMYSVDGNTGGSHEYSYDGRGNLTEVYQLIDQQKSLLHTNHYDDKGQLIETKFYQTNKYFTDSRPESFPSDQRIIFNYDMYGNKTEELTWNRATLVKHVRYYFVK